MSPSELDCPRCSHRLEEVFVGPLVLRHCSVCGGIWFDRGHLEQLKTLAQADTPDLTNDDLAAALSAIPSSRRRVSVHGYASCPVCRKLMSRRNYGRVSGILLDQCLDHGWWTDHTEATRIIAMCRGDHSQLDDEQTRRIDQLQAELQRARTDIAIAEGRAREADRSLRVARDTSRRSTEGFAWRLFLYLLFEIFT